MTRDQDVISLGPPERLIEQPHVSRVALSPAGQVVFIQGFQPSTLLVSNLSDPQNVRVLGEVNWRGDLEVSADGRYVSAYREESGTTIWDLQTGQLAAALPCRGLWSAFSSDSRHLFSSDAHNLCVWEVSTANQLRCTAATADRIAASPDGRLLAARTGLSRIQLFRTDTLKEVATFEYPGLTPHSVAFSPDSALLAAFMTRNLATVVWDLRRIRAGLAERDLDWDLPPYSTSGDGEPAPLGLEIDAAAID